MASLGLVFALAAPFLRADAPVDGTYKLSVVSGNSEFTFWLIKLETKNGNPGATVVEGVQLGQGSTVKSVAVDGKQIRLVLKTGGGDSVAEGRLPTMDQKTILGSMDISGRLYPATLTLTELTKLEPKVVRTELSVPPIKKAAALTAKVQALMIKAQRGKDADEKAKLFKEAAEANREAQAELPKLHQEILDKYASNPAVFESALSILRGATKSDLPVERVRLVTEKASNTAAAYGRRWQLDFGAQIADTLSSQKKYGEVALVVASNVEKLLGPQDSADMQSRVLKALATAQRNSGKTDAAQATAARLAKVENLLDREYLTKVPPFKGEAFAGRKTKSQRVVTMELFTGAQCPPCVAADVAFDVLQKTYKPSELVLIQYHMHIPGPDPMTNPSSEARWDYYRKTFPNQIRGTPSTLFNGKPDAAGGGGMAQAEGKYKQYQSIIDPLLETEAGAKITGSAVKEGDKLDIKVEVIDVSKPGDELRLRLILVEETIRYVGGNKLRFHHQVVRDLPGGPDGFALKDKSSKHAASVDLAELRKTLTRYLDDYGANKRPFPSSDRPLDFRNLRVIALVQDDATREILQAAQLEIMGQREAATAAK
jgi:hypothetical protein